MGDLYFRRGGDGFRVLWHINHIVASQALSLSVTNIHNWNAKKRTFADANTGITY